MAGTRASHRRPRSSHAENAAREAAATRNPRQLGSHRQSDRDVHVHWAESKASRDADGKIPHLSHELRPRQHGRIDDENRRLRGRGHSRRLLRRLPMRLRGGEKPYES